MSRLSKLMKNMEVPPSFIPNNREAAVSMSVSPSPGVNAVEQRRATPQDDRPRTPCFLPCLRETLHFRVCPYLGGCEVGKTLGEEGIWELLLIIQGFFFTSCILKML